MKPAGGQGSDLLATADRLQERTERLADSTARLQMRAKKLEQATARLRRMTAKLTDDDEKSGGQ
jgi:hypothetical protein